MLSAGGAPAAVTFYTDEAAWTAAVNAVAVDSLDTTAANLALADELPLGAPQIARARATDVSRPDPPPSDARALWSPRSLRPLR